MTAEALAPYDAVVLLSFGGPERPDAVMPFLRRVTAGPQAVAFDLDVAGESAARGLAEGSDVLTWKPGRLLYASEPGPEREREIVHTLEALAP